MADVRKRRVNWGLLLVAAVGLIAVFILVTVNSFVIQGTDQSRDAQSMRRLYGAIFLYETDDNGVPPLDLAAVRDKLLDDSSLRAVNDPWPNVGPSGRESKAPPLDPAFPDLPYTAPTRISFTYLPFWVSHGGVKIKGWRQTLDDVRVGLLASYWYGDIDSGNEDGRHCSGPVIRINMDGSVFRLPKRSNADRLTAEDLFFRR